MSAIVERPKSRVVRHRIADVRNPVVPGRRNPVVAARRNPSSLPRAYRAALEWAGEAGRAIA